MKYIVVDPVGSKFAKALQQGLSSDGMQSFRISSRRWSQKRQWKHKAFIVTQHPLDKIEQYERFRENQISAPAYATSVEEAKQLDAKTLFARALINSTNGRGIIEFESGDAEYPRASVYTEYIPKKAEYRVHVFHGKVIDVQQKKKKRGFEGDRDTRVRNCVNGYVYVRNDVVPPEGMLELATKAVAACDYNYGAVDIIYNEKRNMCYVLEVNSRPGLMGTTLVNYVNALKEYFQ
jgi:glutathione synthase/RimK-type ligase-like ATP-grasp enzyme